jgi:hypothetical protein
MRADYHAVWISTSRHPAEVEPHIVKPRPLNIHVPLASGLQPERRAARGFRGFAGTYRPMPGWQRTGLTTPGGGCGAWGNRPHHSMLEPARPRRRDSSSQQA